jgi:hypothetical protein
MRAGTVLNAAVARKVTRMTATIDQVAGTVTWWPSVRAATSAIPAGMPRIAPGMAEISCAAESPALICSGDAPSARAMVSWCRASIAVEVVMKSV